MVAAGVAVVVAIAAVLFFVAGGGGKDDGAAGGGGKASAPPARPTITSSTPSSPSTTSPSKRSPARIGTWQQLPAAPVPARFQGPAVWTGKEFVIYGPHYAEGSGLRSVGAAYNPASNAWRRLPLTPDPPEMRGRQPGGGVDRQ